MANVDHSLRQHTVPEVTSLAVGVFSADEAGNLIWANPAFTSMAGVGPKGVLNLGWMSHIPDDQRTMVAQEWDRCIRQRQPFEMEFYFVHEQDNSHRGVRVLGQASVETDESGQFVGMTGTLTSLPGRREFEELVLRTFKATSPATGLQFYRALTTELAEAMNVKYCVVAELSDGNEKDLEICGMWDSTSFTTGSCYKIAGTPCEVVLRDGIAFCPTDLQSTFPNDEDLVEMQALSYLGVRIEDRDGGPVGILAVLDDKSLPHCAQSVHSLQAFAVRAAAEIERQKAIKALEASEVRYKALFLDSPVPMAEQDFSRIPPFLDELRERGAENLRTWFNAHPEDLEGCAKLIRILRMNTAMLKLVGEPSDYVLPRAGLCPQPHSKDSFIGELQAVADGLGSHEVETSVQSRCGRTVPIELKLIEVSSNGPPLSRVLVSMVDLTRRKAEEEERRALQAKMQQAQKLESLGVLAGGIAHDFNNLLVGVLGNADLALETSPSDPELREMLLEIRSAAHYASDLSTQMLAYSGGGNFSVRAVDLATLVLETVNLLESSTSKKSELEIFINGELPTIDGDPSPIRQVVMNLVTNASEAIGDEPGQLKIRLGHEQFGRERLADAFVDDELPAQEFVFIEVSDTGCGMSSEVLAKLFDPFYTTKFTGRGLGMAAVLGIVRSHGGAILIDTNLGVGSTFTVLFPLGKLPAGPTGGSTEPLKEEPSDGELILIVDDEEPVRNLVSRVLLRAGYDVLLAENGRDAIRIYRDNVASIRAVLLDMSMPVMDGADTSRQLYEINPDVRILFSSGYEESNATQRVEHEGTHYFIQKPYVPRDLIHELRFVITQPV